MHAVRMLLIHARCLSAWLPHGGKTRLDVPWTANHLLQSICLRSHTFWWALLLHTAPQTWNSWSASLRDTLQTSFLEYNLTDCVILFYAKSRSSITQSSSCPFLDILINVYLIRKDLSYWLWFVFGGVTFHYLSDILSWNVFVILFSRSSRILAQ